MKIKMNTSLLFYIYAIVFCLFTFSLGTSFPLPWYDEAVYIFPALSFKIQTNFTHEIYGKFLSSDAPLFMPLGSSFIKGLIFKLFGFSFSWGRFLSCLFMMGALGILFKIYDRLKSSLWIYLASLVIFSTPIAIAVANNLRMESLFLFFTLWALLSVLDKKINLSLVLSAYSILVHPNGIYFFFFTLIIWLYYLVKENRNFFQNDIKRTHPLEIALSMVFIGLGIFNLILILSNWNLYYSDMQYQVQRKASRVLLLAKIKDKTIIGFSLFSLLFYFKRYKEALVVLFSLSFFYMDMFGQEMWYQFYGLLFFTMLLIAVSPIATELSEKFSRIIKTLSQKQKIFLQYFIFISLIFLIYKSTAYRIYTVYKDMTFAGMRMPLNFKSKNTYWNLEEQKIIETTLLEIKDTFKLDKPRVLINSYSGGETLFFFNFFVKNGFEPLVDVPCRKHPAADITIYINKKEMIPQWLIQYGDPYLKGVENIEIFYKNKKIKTISKV